MILFGVLDLIARIDVNYLATTDDFSPAYRTQAMTITRLAQYYATASSYLTYNKHTTPTKLT